MNTMFATVAIETSEVSAQVNNFNVLSNEDIMKVAPHTFADAPTNKDLSEQYFFIPTSRILEDMNSLSWNVVGAKQPYGRKTTISSYHEITFQNKDINVFKTVTDANGNSSKVFDCAPQLFLTNSHDGFHSFTFKVGFSNGVIINTPNCNKFIIRHKNYSLDELRLLINDIVACVPEQVELMNKMQKRTLSIEEKREIALYALRYRRGDDEFEVGYEILDDILSDANGNIADNLWDVFTNINRKMVKGGFKVPSPKTGRLIKARGIKAIDRRVKLCQNMFAKAYEFVA